MNKGDGKRGPSMKYEEFHLVYDEDLQLCLKKGMFIWKVRHGDLVNKEDGGRRRSKDHKLEWRILHLENIERIELDEADRFHWTELETIKFGKGRCYLQETNNEAFIMELLAAILIILQQRFYADHSRANQKSVWGIKLTFWKRGCCNIINYRI